MGKLDKNNLLSRSNVYGTPTLTAKELRAGANKLGEWFLNGIGALGRVLNAGFTSSTYGTNGQVSYARNIQDANRLRLLSEALEQALAKGSTYIMPTNYIVGKGNPVKGEKKISQMEPWKLATIRGAELYFGPKAVKGVKKIPATIDTGLSKAGNTSAKGRVIARELNRGIKENTKNGRIEVNPEYFKAKDKWYRLSERPEKIGIEELGKNITTHDDPEIPGTIGNWRSAILDNRKGLNGKSKRIVPKPDNGFVLEEGMNFAKHGQAHGNTSQGAKGLVWEGTFAYSNRFPGGIIEGQAPNKVFRGMTTEGKDSRSNFILLNWEDVPMGARIGFHTGEMPMENLGWFLELSNGKYTYEPIIPLKRIQVGLQTTLEPKGLTSLKFFERKPSKISEAERLGLSKGDRGNLSLNLKLAIEDLALYRNSGQYRQVFRVTPDWEDFGWNLNRNNPTFMLLFAADGEIMKGPFARVLLLTPTGKGVIAWNPNKNMGGYSSRSFNTPEGLKYAPGEANMMLEGPNLKVILTSPRVDILDFMDELITGSAEDLALFKSLDSQLKRTINKDVMKDFWINSRKVQRPGSYMSGDNGFAPLGSTLIEAFKKKQLYKTPLLERPINLLFIRRTGLSPDSYSSIIRLGNRDGSLRWGEGFTKWNNSAVKNKNIYDAYQQLMEGKISPEQYEGIFNRWSLEIGGRPLLWTTIGELKIPVHPHPYIYAKKQGGKMNIIEFLKNGSGIHIKKKNRGKFTSYCGGKVTDECILKGKNSSNPAIRKRATFADNARHFKHRFGGILMFLLLGNKIDWGGLATNALTSGLLTYQLIKLNNEAINQLILLNKELKKNPMLLMTLYLLKILEDNLRKKQAIEALGSTVNFNPDIDKHFAYQLANQDVAEENQNIDELNKLLDTLRKALNTLAWTNFGLGLLLTGMNAGLLYLANKKNSTNNSATT